jgi:uncharacterized transporter YbjL
VLAITGKNISSLILFYALTYLIKLLGIIGLQITHYFVMKKSIKEEANDDQEEEEEDEEEDEEEEEEEQEFKKTQ